MAEESKSDGVEPVEAGDTPTSEPSADEQTPVAADASPDNDTPIADPARMEQSLDDLQQAISAAADPGQANAPTPSGDGDIDDATLEELLKQASFDAPGGLDPATVPGADPIDLPNFTQVIQDAQVSSIDLLRDVDLNVKIELGRSRMLVEDVLKLGEGSVVELDKLAGDPVDVFVNERLVARGEVLVLNDTFCVRINEIVPGVKEEGM